MANNKAPSVTDFDGGGETIVLLHGFLASSQYWKKLQPHLSEAGYRVIAIDLLGFGKAPKPRNADYSYDSHITHLHTQLQQLDISAPFTLVGHSMGALLAARYGRLYPEDVSGLVLLHPPLYKDKDEAYSTLRKTSRLYRFLLDSRYRRVGWVAVKIITHRHTGNHSRMAREKSLRNVIEKAEAFKDLTEITTRTLLVVGTKDRAEYIHNLTQHSLSDAVTVTQEDVAHHSPLRHPQLIHEKIEDFINRC